MAALGSDVRCVRPLEGFRAFGGGITFSRRKSTGIRMQVRCGQCVGCRLYRTREWAIRMMHEAQVAGESCFLTLTYADDALPENGSLAPSDHTHFLKRLRRRIAPTRVRFFHCGEYGETNLRPHFHTVLFGYSYADRIPCGSSPSGLPIYRSPTLDDDWSRDGKNLGRAVIGDLTFESAQYVAKYVTKQISLSKASSEDAYRRFENRNRRVDPETGELVEVVPEYATCSNRPGLGASWLEQFMSDVFPHDRVVMRGEVMPVPRYYDKLLERWDPDLMASVKRRRLEERDRSDDGESRLLAMEKCANARLTFFGGRD